MPLPQGSIPLPGVLIDTTGSLLTATTTLRDANAISLRGAKLQRVNDAGDGWEEIPGHVIAAAEPTETFEGQLWYDTANNMLMVGDGSSFSAIGGGIEIHTGSGSPASSLGKSGDWYLRNSNGQWFEKVNTTWHGRFTPPALSDSNPLATSSSPDEGTAVDASRSDHIHVGLLVGDTEPEDVDGTAAAAGTSGHAARTDHVHNVPDATRAISGIVEIASNDESLDATDATHAVPPAGVQHALDERASDADPEDVSTAAAPGTSTDLSRSDHVHVGDGTGGGGGGGAALSDDDPEPVGTALDSGTDATASRDDHVHNLTFNTVIPSAVAVVGDVGANEHPARADHVHSGVFASDADPQDVGDDADEGTNSGASRSDHAHELPTDNTLTFHNNGNLAVNISDVVEHLQQSIRYYTTEDDYSTDGSAAGQVYDTSRYPKNISHVSAHLRPPGGISDAIYRAGIYIVTSGNQIMTVLAQSEDTGEVSGEQTVNFNMLAESTSTLGVPLSGGERIAVLIRRIGDGNEADTGLRHGSENENSPNVSYADANLDFVLDNHVIYRHEHPAPGNDTHSHGDNIRGNIRIYYNVTIDHGSLIGDESVSADHMDSGSATDGQALLADGAGGADYEDLPMAYQGHYNNAVAYAIGESVTANSHLWMAPTAIAAGEGSPSLVSPHNWSLISRADQYLGHLLASNSYDLLEGNWYRVGHRLFFAILDVAGVTGTNLTGGHANIVELTSHRLTQAQAEDNTNTTFGLVSGERLSQAVAEFESGGGGTDDQTADEVTVDTTNFSRNLTAADDSVQAALETIDGFTQYQGAWQQAAWPAGVIVRRSGIAYISLVNNNTEIPTPDATQWAGLAEGFTYRGEAPVAATNYNYGHVVLEPATDVYYFFASTISASVARADIATHANFHVIGGATGHSPRVNSGNAFPTTPAPLANDIFFFDTDVASGLDWKDTDGTTDLTAATAGDMARYDGTDWIKVVNLVGGGGLVVTDVELLAPIDLGTTGQNGNLVYEVNLAEPLADGQLVRVNVSARDASSGRAIGYAVFLSDDLRDKPSRSSAPTSATDIDDALPMQVSSVSNDALGDNAGANINIWYNNDTTLYVNYTRPDGINIEIRALPLGGSGGTDAQLAGGLTEQVIVGSRLATTEYGLGTLWTAVVDAISPTISPPIDPDNLLQIAVGLRIDTEAAPEIIISGASIRRITHTNDPLPSTAVSSDEIPGAYYSARVPQNNEDRGIEINPTLSWMEKRRQAGRYGLLFAFTDNAAGNLTSIRPFVSSGTEIDIEYIVAIIGV